MFTFNYMRVGHRAVPSIFCFSRMGFSRAVLRCTCMSHMTSSGKCCRFSEVFETCRTVVFVTAGRRIEGSVEGVRLEQRDLLV